MEKDGIIRFEKKGAVGLLLLDRPQKANAYTDDMIRQAGEALDLVTADPEIRCLVVASAVEGRFCAGSDLDEVRSRRPEEGLAIPSAALFDRIEALPIPVIASIDGPAFAGGLELALACDVRIATPRARFALPETRLGILPAAGATWRLPRAVGQSVAREMILLGAMLDAGRALTVGLVSEVVPTMELSARVLKVAGSAAALDAAAVAAAKEALNRALCSDTGRVFVAETQARFYGRNRETKG